ncbi:MAG: HEAT repeat domain-containing protein [Vicinamibacteria bacterium]
MTEAPPPAPEPEPEPEQRQTTPFLVLQFFIFPMAIVAACVAVFVVFGLISSDAKTARDHLADVRRGGGMFGVKRWQAAFAFASALDSAKEEAKRDPELLRETLALFEESKNDDPRVRRYLALALGRMRDPAAVPALLGVVRSPQDDPDGETVVHAVLALGVIGDPAAVPDLIALSAQPDAGLRKVALHALRTFDRDDARAALRQALADPVADVRWNAALGLARWRDPAATPVIAQMLDRAQLGGVPDLTPDQANDVVLQAVNGAALLGDASLQPALARLRDADPDLKVREAARKALPSR